MQAHGDCSPWEGGVNVAAWRYDDEGQLERIARVAAEHAAIAADVQSKWKTKAITSKRWQVEFMNLIQDSSHVYHSIIVAKLCTEDFPSVLQADSEIQKWQSASRLMMQRTSHKLYRLENVVVDVLRCA